MPQVQPLKRAVKQLVKNYVHKVSEFDTDKFLATGVDPFRFTFNVAAWGLTATIKKEIEHKLEMALENYIGDFHEEYLGHTTKQDTGSAWEKVPNGTIPGVDIANREDDIYLQIKSKHNSMNSSSSAKLAQELAALSKSNPNATVGCAWVVARKSKPCIGENGIAAVGTVIKGKQVYDYVTGTKDEMEKVLQLLPSLIDQEIASSTLCQDITRVCIAIEQGLTARAKALKINVCEFMLQQSID